MRFPTLFSSPPPSVLSEEIWAIKHTAGCPWYLPVLAYPHKPQGSLMQKAPFQAVETKFCICETSSRLLLICSDTDLNFPLTES